MADSTTNNNGMISTLPVELRDLIWKFVLEGHELRVGHNGTRRRARVIRRFTSDSTVGEELRTTYYLPHPLFYVNHFINGEIQRAWQHLNGSLQIDSRLTRFPPQVYSGLGITSLSLTLAQVAEILPATVPHLHSDAPRFQPYLGSHVPPTTPLVLTHGLHIQHLEIRLRMDFRDGITLLWHTALQTAFVRLQYFRRSFQVTVRVQATSGTSIAATGTIRDINNIQPSDFQYDSRLVPSRMEQRGFERSIRRFGLRLGHLRRPRSPQYLSLINAHPRYSFAPLGWRNPGVDEFWYYNVSRPQNIPPQLALPRPLDNELPPAPDA